MSRGAFYSVLSYLSYRFTSKSKYGIHSPFVYDLITNVLQKKQPVPAFNEIRKIYQEQARNSRVVETTDFGAYAKNRSYVTRFMKVKQIARGSSVDRRTGELLYRLVSIIIPGTSGDGHRARHQYSISCQGRSGSPYCDHGRLCRQGRPGKICL
jgi:hypothetical protein